MHGHRVDYIADPGPLRTSSGLRNGLLGVGIAGLAVFAASALAGSVETRQQTWAGFMVSMVFFWFLAMGGASFLAIQYVVNARWFVVIKRLPEALASFAYRIGWLLPIVALFGMAYIYPWVPSGGYEEIWGKAGPDYPYAGTMKAAWLSPGMHVVRTFLYIVPLTLLTWLLVRLSGEASSGLESAAASRRRKLSIIYLIVFAVTFSLFAWEMIMSVQPKWFSTMFGVYCFSGAFVSAMALMMLLMFHMKKQTPHLHGRHMYDMGTMVMAFATFMMYIGFSQFMLIWYANLHDETFWYLERYEGGWWAVTVALPVLKWAIPFFVLMPPKMRTNLAAQTFCCVSILAGQLLDMYWVFYPAYFESVQLPGVVNVLTFVGVGGLFGWSVLSHLNERSLLPVEDAELLSSVNGDYLHA